MSPTQLLLLSLALLLVPILTHTYTVERHTDVGNLDDGFDAGNQANFHHIRRRSSYINCGSKVLCPKTHDVCCSKEEVCHKDSTNPKGIVTCVLPKVCGQDEKRCGNIGCCQSTQSCKSDGTCEAPEV